MPGANAMSSRMTITKQTYGYLKVSQLEIRAGIQGWRMRRILISNFELRIAENKEADTTGFCHLNFGIRICFEFRYSDFGS